MCGTPDTECRLTFRTGSGSRSSRLKKMWERDWGCGSRDRSQKRKAEGWIWSLRRKKERCSGSDCRAERAWATQLEKKNKCCMRGDDVGKPEKVRRLLKNRLLVV